MEAEDMINIFVGALTLLKDKKIKRAQRELGSQLRYSAIAMTACCKKS